MFHNNCKRFSFSRLVSGATQNVVSDMENYMTAVGIVNECLYAKKNYIIWHLAKYMAFGKIRKMHWNWNEAQL